VIEIDHDGGNRAAISRGEAGKTLGHVFDGATIVEPGERIAQRLCPELFA